MNGSPDTTALPIGVLVLAAGASRRLGTPKQLLPYLGKSLLRHAAQAALDAACGPVIAVLGAYREHTEKEITDLPLEIAVNTRWETGMASSIHVGLEHLMARLETRAVIVMLCDQPRVDAELVKKLVSTYEETHAPLVAAGYSGTHGVPALFDRRLYPALLKLAGAQGAKRIMLANAAHLVEVPAPQAAQDIDTLADYERLQEREPWLRSAKQ